MQFKRIVMMILIFCFVGLTTLTIRYSIATTPAIHNENGIASLEKISIGNVDQSLLIRGKDLSKPVLLFIHGGPGFAEMVFTRHFNADLEDNFIVINWDQRGAGKSFNSKIDEKTMTADQILADTYEVVQYVKDRFQKDKIFIAGHSWGSFLGLTTVKEHPKDFHAYIGIGQLINGNKGEALSYKWTKKMAAEDNNKKAIKELEALEVIDGVYLHGHDEKHVQRKWLWHYRGFLYNLNVSSLYFRLAIAPEYTILDKINYIRGVEFSEDLIGEEWLENLKFDEEIKSLEVPVFFMQGKYDFNTPSELVKKFYDAVDAPMKEYIEFEYSAHSPNFEEPEKFNKVMAEIAEIVLKQQ
ncbi:Pimeloyl-ACP methyl ester carboxylesterase [Natronincola peptidivorans]|uniref:prolyl aminopeptidase n=1 Tax=Natronincola peptidivorans TaxID=426128 RepID=A0A1I0AVQ3_9FIRM|nr:alpha/beta hydrolase [Natronincola peptidivorans]SES98493.1 Pimeloyl-ACP methyl ester carboxylesterase [Natronincola peptidivorans]